MTLLDKTIEIFSTARSSIIHGIKNLYEIRDKGLWTEKAASFTEFVEQDCQLDKGQVSRWLTMYEHYAITHGVELTQLEEINPERLYEARKLKGSVETQLISAEKLSKNQLRAELAVKEDGSEHTCIAVSFCEICHRRMD